MLNPIAAEHFTDRFLKILDVSFENGNVYLDRGTSIFETLETISAEEASHPVSPTCATIAAHVEHLRVALDFTDHYIRTSEDLSVDWGDIWRTVSAVTPVEWDASKLRLKVSYQNVREAIQSHEDWNSPHVLLEAFGVVAHSAYHLGEIRHALCTIKQGG